MGTRSGDIDPGLHAYLADNLGLDVHKITEILNKKSGLKGLCGKADMPWISHSYSYLGLAHFCRGRWQEALDAYLAGRAGEAEKRRRALMLRGALREEEADGLREATRRLRESWR